MINRSGDFQKKFYAFTLIELLIVVAIIAILAAIAVPNFLEAQTRAKISRVHSDMRTIATAQEAYVVDHNRPSIGRAEAVSTDEQGLRIPDEVYWRWALLTTPISYLSSIPQDPFLNQGMVRKTGANQGSDYTFENFVRPYTKTAAVKSLYGKGYTWSLHSFGPSRKWGADLGFTVVERILDGRGFPTEYPNSYYDPTNGTMSYGWLIRTNRGIEPASPLK